MTDKITDPETLRLVKTAQDMFELRNGFRPNTVHTLQIAMERLLDQESVKDARYWLDILENAEPHLYEMYHITEGIIRESMTWRPDRLKEAIGCHTKYPGDDNFVRTTVYHLTSKSPENPNRSFFLTGDNRDMVNKFIGDNWKDRTLPIRFILCKWIQSDYLMEIMDDTDETRLYLHIGQQYDPEKLDALDEKMKRPMPDTVTSLSSREEKGKKTPQRIIWKPKVGKFECWDIDPKTKKQKKLWMRGETCKRGLASYETNDD